MKKLFILILLINSILLNARFQNATILFNDGHSETGLVKSFLEQRTISAGFSSNLEHELNLDDKIIKFKLSNDAEVKDLSIDDIKQITISYENNYSITYRVLYLKELDKKGDFKEKSRKVFLPLLKEGKINIYGLRYSTQTGSGSGPYTGEVFYYQNAEEDYAINYFNMGFSAMFNIQQRTLNPFRILFKDCPSALKEIDNFQNKWKNASKEERKAKKEEEKKLMKEYGELDKNQRKDLLNVHHYQFNDFEKLISSYENCN